jgi:hypothetical protein
MAFARLQVAVEDPVVAEKLNLGWESIRVDDEPFFLDGPVSARVAVIDRDAASGALSPVAWREKSHDFDASDGPDGAKAMAVSVFGIVLRTLAMFERHEVLGHSVRWQFGSPQLLVVPNAGEWANAAYDRYSRSLQFYSFLAGRRRVYTALSRNIVAHETGHAVLDALAPALYDALDPEALALHEAVADLTAIVMALESRSIQQWLVNERGASLAGRSPIAQIGEQFGQALRRNRPLRDANNDRRMSQAGDEPHDLCEVLTGAVWKSMVQMHEHALREARTKSPRRAEVLPMALAISARRIARVLFRALDYIPPAETTFTDYARAILRADMHAHPDDPSGYRRLLQEEFERRGVCPPGAIDPDAAEPLRPMKVDVDELIESDWAAYQFVDAHREELGLGRDRKVPFRLFPRRDVMRTYFIGNRERELRREVVLQFTWEQDEPNPDVPGVPRRRRVFRGTTLVLSGTPDARGKHRVLSCLTTDRERRHVDARSRFVARIAEAGMIAESEVPGTSRRPLQRVAHAHISGDTIRFRGTARMLHLARP